MSLKQSCFGRLLVSQSSSFLLDFSWLEHGVFKFFGVQELQESVIFSTTAPDPWIVGGGDGGLPPPTISLQYYTNRIYKDLIIDDASTTFISSCISKSLSVGGNCKRTRPTSHKYIFLSSCTVFLGLSLDVLPTTLQFRVFAMAIRADRIEFFSEPYPSFHLGGVGGSISALIFDAFPIF